MVCIGTGYTGRKFGDFLGLSKLESDVGSIESLEGRMMPRSRECMVCIGTGYTGRKFGDFLGLSKLERCVGCIEGL